MTLAELETIARLPLYITAVVFDDAALSLIDQQTEGEGDSKAARYGAIDVAEVARGLGLPATRADSSRELRAAPGHRSRGPALIDARIDPTDYAAVLRATGG